MKIGFEEDDDNDGGGNLLDDQSEPGGELFLHLLQLEVLLRALQVSRCSPLVTTIMMIEMLTISTFFFIFFINFLFFMYVAALPWSAQS